MKLLNRFLVVIALMTLVSSSAFAATNIYKDRYTTEDSAGLWTFTNFSEAGKKTPLTVISAAADTIGTVTAAKTGYTFVLGPTAPNVGGVGYILTLPTAAAGLTYSFTTATNSTLAVRNAATTDVIYYGYNNTSKITSPASTGSTVTLVGNTNAWYVQSMGSGAVPTSNVQNWTPGTR